MARALDVLELWVLVSLLLAWLFSRAALATRESLRLIETERNPTPGLAAGVRLGPGEVSEALRLAVFVYRDNDPRE